MDIKIAGIKEVSLVDVIGHPALTIWFPFCNFRCPWCQNWPIVLGKDVRVVSLDEIREAVEESADFVDFVHVTGGEPTLHPKALRAVFEIAKGADLGCSLNTNGSVPSVVESLYRDGLLDHVAMDVKAPLSNRELYGRVTGTGPSAPVERISRTLDFLIGNLDFLELRTTYVPYLLSEEDIVKVAVELAERGCSSNCYWVLQQFVPASEAPDERFRSAPRTPVEELLRVARRAKEESGLKNVYVRTIERGVIEV